jgi:hypothetical protein
MFSDAILTSRLLLGGTFVDGLPDSLQLDAISFWAMVHLCYDREKLLKLV